MTAKSARSLRWFPALLALVALLLVRVAYAGASSFFAGVERESAALRAGTSLELSEPGAVHPLLECMPSGLRRWSIGALRWAVPGAHSASVRWPEGDLANAQHTKCLLIERRRAQLGNPEPTTRIGWLLNTGRRVAIPESVREQLLVEEDELRLRRGARLTFAQLCLAD